METRGRGNPAWQKGKSGNPAGRPKSEVYTQVRELANTFAPEAIHALVDIMRDREAKHSVRVTAANSLLDRAIGRPTAAVEITTDSAGEALLSLIANQVTSNPLTRLKSDGSSAD